jgi:hypothetical protein
MRPSSPSMTAATTMKEAACGNRPSMPKRMATRPKHRPIIVIRLGISRLKDGPRKRGRWRGPRRRSLPRRLGLVIPPPRASARSASTVSPPIMVWPTSTLGFTPSGRVDVGAAAEADDAEAVAGLELVALAHVADDAARDQPGDLHAGELAAIRQVEAQRVALVLRGGLLHAGVDEGAVAIGDAADAALHGRVVHVNVEHGEEDGHAPARRLAHLELGRRDGGANEDDLAVGGRDDEVTLLRGHALGVAEEVEAEEREGHADPEEPGPQDQPAHHGDRGAPIDEGLAGRDAAGRGRGTGCWRGTCGGFILCSPFCGKLRSA